MKKKQAEAFDVVVIGGGPAGVPAAIQAARAGAKTLLVERTGMLGGTTTVGGVSFPGIFHAWGRQVIAGIGWELVERCVREGGGKLPDFSKVPDRPNRHQIWINPSLYAALCDEAAEAAGVNLLFHAMPAAMESSPEGWTATLCTKSGLHAVTTRLLIDCTGDANVVALAGGSLRFSSETQPATLVCRLRGYDPATTDLAAIERSFEEAVRVGKVSYTDVGWRHTASNISLWLRSRGGNLSHIDAMSAHTSEGRTRLELDARRALLRVFRFLKKQPGLELLEIEWMAAECGVRETAVIEGEKTVTLEDYTSGRVWDDAVCYSYYPIDLHTRADPGLDFRLLATGVVPTIPLGALLPRGTRNLLAAGRCICSDRLAHSALRVQATCMATGQAAGAVAALAAQRGVDAREVERPALLRLLQAHGAIVV
ncbi:MAG: FAD-dependent oxidoreductase [Kiritimatiellia bacterium]|nr:FAD-dependent oxidoreductase [Kiritimatiellia bacterium]